MYNIIDERDSIINHILYIVDIDKYVCGKFDDNGCSYINYQDGRLYRRNNFFYHIDYSSDYIYILNIDGGSLHYDDDDECMGENQQYCHDCQRYYRIDTGVNKFLRISTFMQYKELSLNDIINKVWMHEH